MEAKKRKKKREKEKKKREEKIFLNIFVILFHTIVVQSP